MEKRTYIYFIDGEVIIETGDVKIYEMDGKLFLEKGPGHNFWADSMELKDYQKQIGNSPKGDCLEIGLGLGIASNYILSCPNVKSLTTVEFDLDVINAYRHLEPIPNPKHKIICQSGYVYMMYTKNKYDFIFLDFYSIIDNNTLKALVEYKELAENILNPGGIIKAWFDPYTLEYEAEEFFKLFGDEYRKFLK